MKDEIVEMFQNFELNIPPNLHKIKEVNVKKASTETDNEQPSRLLGVVECTFYNTNEQYCYDFYKHISRVMNDYGL